MLPWFFGNSVFLVEFFLGSFGASATYFNALWLQMARNSPPSLARS